GGISWGNIWSIAATLVTMAVAYATLQAGQSTEALRHPVDEIIVHCAATRPDRMTGRGLARRSPRSGAGT
ncbi:MAG: hypothetical protein ACK46Q_08570, partial [Hyphomonas sp.]